MGDVSTSREAAHFHPDVDRRRASPLYFTQLPPQPRAARSGFKSAHLCMLESKTRRAIAWEAARLMYGRQESEYFRAKIKAARRLGFVRIKSDELPSNSEIREQVQTLARLYEGSERLDNLRGMRIEALRLMRLLQAFRPRLIGSVLTGHVRRGSDIDIHVFCDNTSSICAVLDGEGMTYDVERKRVRKHGEERVFTHIHIRDRFPFELTVYAESLYSFPFKSSITGKTIERAGLAELEALLGQEYPELAIDEAVVEAEQNVDRFQIYRLLLLPLEKVKQDPRWHPEGDVLYHSLQVYDLMSREVPYDEEMLLAALLHDVGKGIDKSDHVAAGLEALEGFITPRTAWLIEHHMEAQELRAGTLGARAVRRLGESELGTTEDLLLLAQCDQGGRERNVEVPDLDDALDAIRDLADSCEEA